MSVSPGFAELLRDLLSPMGGISVRRMFGGGGVYCDGLMFGLVSDDALYLKANDESRKAFEAEGCGPFIYQGKGKPIAMSYWRTPERLLDEPDEMLAWARIALAIARKRASAKGGRSAAKPRKAAASKPAAPRSK